MIDELIPDLADPQLRALYDALLGRRKPTWEEINVLVAVAGGMREATDLIPAKRVAQVVVILERAWQLDERGCKDRLEGYCKDLGKRQDERTARAEG